MFNDAKIIDVNLTTSEIKITVLPGDTYRKYPGGSALAAYLLLKNMDPKVEALSEGNVLVFAVSPLTGLPISGSSRLVVSAKSPLTGAIGDSQAGGFFPAILKGNGYDAVLFRGKAERPVYLYIDKEKIEIKNAECAWGKITGDAEKAIRKDLGEEKVEIAQIGPAGENLVRFASVINMCQRANGRTGMGTVMGAKNLKAVVCKKNGGLTPVDKDNFLELAKLANKKIDESEAITMLGIHGTDIDFEPFSEEGFLITNNWQKYTFPEGAHNLAGETMTETILKGRGTCYACAIRCKRKVEVKGIVDPLYGGPEYETTAAFGSFCGVTDLTGVALANQLCNAYGMDTISCGATIAFAMECFEKGFISEVETDGLELKFGNHDAMNKMVKMIALREGIGDILAEGSYRASEKFGEATKEFCVTCKGQEFAAHMPQNKPGMGLIYAVNPFGPDHVSNEHDTWLMMPKDSQEMIRIAQLGVYKDYDDSFATDDEKLRYAFYTQIYFSLMDTLCLCMFAWGPCWELYNSEDLVKLCKYGIGWDTTMFELMLAGERRINMLRQFNKLAGFTKEDDKLPKRVFQKIIGGPSDGVQLNEEEFENMRKKYYQIAGWDETTGNPTEGILRRLSLEWLI